MFEALIVFQFTSNYCLRSVDYKVQYVYILFVLDVY